MRLADLDPRWLSHGGPDVHFADGSSIPLRERVGVSFRCPCGRHAPEEWWERVAVRFENPTDGGPPIGEKPHWRREHDSFEALTLTPSIQRVGGCAWHGFVTNGEIVSC